MRIRKPGFKAAISVYLPWNPPGVGSAGGIAIPEGQNEAVIPMNADGGAELRTWKIVVNGASGVASGPIMVSSQLANLTISAPYLGLAFQSASVDQGKEVDMAVKVAKAIDFPGEATGHPDRAAQQGHDRRQEDHQGHDRPGLPHQDRQGLARRQPCEPVLPGGGDAERRADRAQHRHRQSPDRRAAAPQGQCPGAGRRGGRRRTQPAPPPPPAKPLTRLEKLRLENQQAKAAGK